jgi:hypothetical protein
MGSPAQRNYAEIERRERLLADLRRAKSTPRQTEAIREIGLAIAIREVGATLTNVDWEQSYAADRRSEPADRS